MYQCHGKMKRLKYYLRVSVGSRCRMFIIYQPFLIVLQVNTMDTLYNTYNYVVKTFFGSTILASGMDGHACPRGSDDSFWVILWWAKMFSPSGIIKNKTSWPLGLDMHQVDWGCPLNIQQDIYILYSLLDTNSHLTAGLMSGTGVDFTKLHLVRLSPILT